MNRLEHIAEIKQTFEAFRKAFKKFDDDGHAIQRDVWLAYGDLKDSLTAFEQNINRAEVVDGETR